MGELRGWYKVCEWISRIALLNVMWLILTFLGIGILGIFPATVSMLVVTRKWLKNEDVSIVKACWQSYKDSFIRANVLGGLLTVICAAIAYDIYYFLQFNSMFLTIFAMFLVFTLVVLLLMFIYLFPLYVQFDLKIKDYFRNAFTLVVIFPFSSFFLILIIIGSMSLINLFPGYIFFCGSIMAYLLMFHSMRMFAKLDKKQSRVMQGA